MTLVAEGKAADIEAMIEGPARALGFEIVRIQLARGSNAKLQIMAERRDSVGMTVDDCAILSKTLEAVLDVEAPIPEPYVLEVSSPGIDRPLTRLDDFERFTGFEAKLETRLPIEGRRRFKGRLLGLDGPNVRLATKEEEVAVAFTEVVKAKLILTDELIEASARAEAEGADPMPASANAPSEAKRSGV